MKKILEEFKEFALKGNVVDMAVGVIIAGAFSAIVTSLTDSFINPLINSIGGAEVAGAIRLPWVDYTGMTMEEISSMSLNYGNFITAIINFLIIAVILFAIVKAMNKVMSIGKKKKEEAPTEKDCPYCKMKIHIDATRCPHCTSKIEE